MKEREKRLFQITIKGKITIWYTCSIAFITIASLAMLFISSNKMTGSMIETKLISAVQIAEFFVEHDDGELEIDNDIDDIEGVNILIYEQDGSLFYGKASPVFKELVFKENQIQTVKVDSTRYYIYDYKVTFKKHADVWVRGIISLDSMQVANTSMIKSAAVILPCLILFAAAGGYFITKRAFRPVSTITKVAKEIGNSGDLSKRIDISTGVNTADKDEISKLAETFNEMFEKLQVSFENERQFTSDASHELRTPTSVIVAQTEYLLSICESAEEQKALEIIMRQAGKMTKLISELLMLARMENNKQQIQWELVNLSELTDIVIEEMEDIAAAKNIVIQTKIEENVLMRADQTLIMRILINLISNAITYGRDGGFVKVEISRVDNRITGTISDNGIGIEKENLERIWERFYQADVSRASKNGSSGLGLSMVKWIVGAHKGIINVDSIPNQGSTFTFIFTQDNRVQLKR